MVTLLDGCSDVSEIAPYVPEERQRTAPPEAAEVMLLAVPVLGVNVWVQDPDPEPPLLATTPDAAEEAEADPPEFVAVTTATSVWPTSDARSV